MRGNLVGLLVLSNGLALAACGPSTLDNPGGGGGAPDAAGGGGGPSEFPDAAEAQACTKMDFVFVIDNSGSMGEEQVNLAANFPQFIQIIDQFQTSTGEPLDYRVAVTSTGRDITYSISIPPFPPIVETEPGDNGAFQQRCTMTRRWLERTDPDVATTFACAAQLGTEGPGIEMPLYAVELALGDRIADGTNAGFLRDDALLAIVILTDENDCSRRDDNFNVTDTELCEASPALIQPQEIVDFLDGLKQARGRWATAVIAGPGPGQCSSTFGDAAEAARLRTFVAQTGQNAVFSSICEGDLAGALEDAINTFDAACQTFPDVD
jgi:hypothetical protein